MRENLLSYSMQEIRVKRSLLVKERQRVSDTKLMGILNTKERNMYVNIMGVTFMVVLHAILEIERQH